MYEIDKQEFSATIRIAERLIKTLQDQIKELRAGTNTEQLMSYDFITYLDDQVRIFERVHSYCILTGMHIMHTDNDNDSLAKHWRDGDIHPLYKHPSANESRVDFVEFLRHITGEDFPEKPPIDNQTTH